MLAWRRDFAQRADLVHAEHQPAQRRHERQARQRDGRDADGVDVAEGEQADRRHGQDQRHGRGDDRRQVALRPGRAGRRAPCRPGEQHHPARPQRVEPGAFDERALGDLQEVDGVGRGEQHEPGADQRQHPAHAPAREHESADHHRDQREVADGIGEVRGDDGRRAAREIDDLGHGEGGAESADGEDAHQAVEPHRRGEAADPGSDQPRERHVRGRVEAEVERVRGGRVRRAVQALEHGAPVDAAEAPADHAGAEQRPRQPLALDLGGAQQTQRARPDRHGAEHVRLEDGIQSQPRVKQRVGEIRDPHAAENNQSSGSTLPGHCELYRPLRTSTPVQCACVALKTRVLVTKPGLKDVATPTASPTPTPDPPTGCAALAGLERKAC